MKKLIIKELSLLSLEEKKAKRVLFDRHRTIILGDNSTGKSFLIKSIYSTFGAEPTKVSENWLNIDPISHVRFSIDEEDFSIMRTGKKYTIFDKNSKKIFSGTSVTKELGPFLAKILDFNIQIRNRQGEMITPPPQYLFLAFYIDQDASWHSNWSSFKNLQQLPSDWKEDLVYYATGIKPNEYYLIKSKLNAAINEKNELLQQEEILKNTIDTIIKGQSNVQFDTNVENFKEEIESLLQECTTLKKIQELLKQKLIEYYNYQSSILSQIDITTQAAKELKSDYNYAINVDIASNIECPVCKASYNNAFAERFSIAQDEDKCKDLLITLQKDLVDINKKIESANNEYKVSIDKMSDINSILQARKENVQLSDLLKIEGTKEIKSVVDNNLKDIAEQIHTIENSIDALKHDIKKYENKEHKDSVIKKYKDYMSTFLYTLGVNLNIDKYEKIYSQINITGSEGPRALLAYYFSILKIMKEQQTSTYCPIIIDSPNQQGQDKHNIIKIFKFIDEFQPTNSQIILGLEDTNNVDFKCPVIKLNHKYRLLQDKDYLDIKEDLTKYIDQALGITN